MVSRVNKCNLRCKHDKSAYIFYENKTARHHFNIINFRGLMCYSYRYFFLFFLENENKC